MKEVVASTVVHNAAKHPGFLELRGSHPSLPAILISPHFDRAKPFLFLESVSIHFQARPEASYAA